MKKNWFTKLIASVLCLTMVVQIPMQAGAAPQQTVQQEEEGAPDSPVIAEEIDEKEEAYILSEEESKREESVKHFRLSNGSYLAAQYDYPVHYQDENGRWQDYDNSLTLTDEVLDAEEEPVQQDASEEIATEAASPESEPVVADAMDANSAEEYKNTASDLDIRLSKKASEKKTVTIEKDGYRMSWGFSGANRSNALVLPSATPQEGDETFLTLPNLIEETWYCAVYPSVDLQYFVTPVGVKENIILKTREAQNEFEMQFKLKGLTPEVQDEKTILLNNDAGDTIYYLTAPMMMDNAGETSQGVSLTLLSAKNNQMTVKLTADRTWLDEENRDYPVKIDPSFETGQEWGAVDSTYIASDMPDTSFGLGGSYYEGSMYVGKENGRGKTRALVRLRELPSLSAGDQIVNAHMNLYNNAASNDLTVYVHEVTKDWDQSTVCWNSNITYDPTVIDYLHASFNTYGNHTWDITTLMRKWYAGENNYGLILESPSENMNNSSRVWYLSSNFPTSADVRPAFQITYRNQKGMEDIWSYTGVESGRSGSALVNNFNGNLVVTQPITSADGNLMPVSISMVYGIRVDHALEIFGWDWCSNYNIRVQWETNPDLLENHYRCYLDDSDGTRHYFYFKDGGDTGKDEDGLGYTFTFGDNAEEYFIITDKDGNQMTFRRDFGTISKIKDTNGNQISMTYTTLSGFPNEYLKTVTDGAGRVYTYNYDDAGHVTSITDPAGRNTLFSYSGNMLASITYPDGKTTDFTYSNEYLTQIDNIDGTRTLITYDNSNPKKVASIRTGTNDTDLASYAFDYRMNETDITDKAGRTVTYQFNHYGQTTGVVNRVSGQAQYYEFGATGLKTVASVTDVNEESNKLKEVSKTQQSIVNLLPDPGINNLSNYTSDTDHFSIDTSHGHFDSKSLKLTRSSPSSDVPYVLAGQNCFNLPAGTYTFSGYINTNNETLGGTGAIIGVEVWDSTNTQCLSGTYSPPVTKTGYTEWLRQSVSVTINEGETLRVMVGYTKADTTGSAWFDDLQLEVGSAANSTNLIENSDFHRGQTSWWTDIPNGESVGVVSIDGVPGADKAIQFDAKSTQPRVIWADVMTSGEAGDVFSAGAWAQANSVAINHMNRVNGNISEEVPSEFVPSFCISIEFWNGSTLVGKRNIPFNAHTSAWQYVSKQVIAPGNYDRVTFCMRYDYNANSVRMTLPYLYKENFGQSYTYDKDGNVVSSVDLADTMATFAYKNDQLAKLTNPTGSRYLYTYENGTNNLTYAHSSDGQRYTFTYDSHGNPTSSKIVSDKPATELVDGQMYHIRNAYSGNALDSGGTEAWEEAHNWEYSPSNQHQLWRVEATDTEDVYQLMRYDSDNNLAVYYAYESDGTNMVLAPAGDGQCFKITRNSDGTFTMFTNATNYKKCVDGQPGDATDTKNGTPIQQYTYKQNDEGQKWYFYPYVENAEADGFMQSTAAYTEDGNYMTSVTDTRGSTSSYTYDETKGLLLSETNPNGTTTSYTYDANNNALTSVQSGGSTVSYEYDNDRLSAIYHNDSQVKYSFAYDNLGRITSTHVGNGTNSSTLMENTYDDRNLVTQSSYGNNQSVSFSYDNLDRLTEKSYSEDEKFSYSYDANGALATLTDSVNDTQTRYTYDLAGRIVNSREEQSDGSLRSQMYYRYENGKNRLSYYTFTVPKNGSATEVRDNTTQFTYGNLAQGQMPDVVYGVTASVQRLAFTYDGLGRLSARTLSVPNRTTSFTYVDGAAENQTSALLKSIDNAGEVYSYTYDAGGNITEIRKDNVLVESYQYDSLNQLTRVNSVVQDRTFTYTYDAGGNLLEKSEYAYTTGELGEALDTIVYAYGDSTWKDVLTGYDGQSFTHDDLANPLTYRDGMTFTWQHGRQLSSVTQGNTTASYLYNDNGIRTQKTVNGVTTKYYLVGDELHGELRNGKDIIYRYDQNGQCYGFQYDGSFFYFEFNGQGDVIRLLNSDGSVRANYAYDAWGKVLNVTDANGNEITDPNHLGRINPIRYRGYYYDEETGFYYLNSRYYDPVTGRFLNADTNFYGRTGIAVANIFSYCDNNPINRTDPTGEIAIADDIIVFGVIALLMVCAAYTTTPDFQASWNSVCTGISDTISSIAGGFTYTKKSGKESSSQHPSWVNKGMIDYGLSADENASRIMNQQYGPGNWKKGPKSEFNQIKKWLVRHEGVRQVVPSSSNPVRQVEKPKPSQSSSSSLKPGQFMGGSGNGHYIDMGGSGKMWVPD